MDEDYETAQLTIALQADPDTFMPQIVLGFPHEGGFVYTCMSAEGSFNLGHYLVRQAMLAQEMSDGMEDMSLDQRREVIDLYAHYFEDSADVDD